MAKVLIKIFIPALKSSSFLRTPLLSFFPKTNLTNPIFNTCLRSFSNARTLKINNKLISTSSKIFTNDNNISSFQIKKRPVRKRKLTEEDAIVPGQYVAVAYATADEYSLESLVEGLKKQDLYVPNVVDNLDDVIHAVARYHVDSEPREIFFFREGSVVFWNVSELECSNVLAFLKQFEQKSYNNRMIQNEAEHMKYSYAPTGKQTHINQQGKILLSVDNPHEFDKYAFSNAMSLSVKLGLWEAQLEKYIDSIEYVTEDLKVGNKIKLTQEAVLRKHGELFALRHMINLSSDLLDVPDFYWDRQNLETIYCQTCGYFSINRRTKVMNEKLNHCVELIELLASHLSDKHHVRLEWMIIILIMVEVAFETLHYIELYYS